MVVCWGSSISVILFGWHPEESLISPVKQLKCVQAPYNTCISIEYICNTQARVEHRTENHTDHIIQVFSLSSHSLRLELKEFGTKHLLCLFLYFSYQHVIVTPACFEFFFFRNSRAPSFTSFPESALIFSAWLNPIKKHVFLCQWLPKMHIHPRNANIYLLSWLSSNQVSVRVFVSQELVQLVWTCPWMFMWDGLKLLHTTTPPYSFLFPVEWTAKSHFE